MQQFALCIFIGSMMGFVSGLIGVGGGIIAVPSMVYFLSMNTRDAMGTSLAVVVLVALSGAYKQFQQSHVDIKAAIPIAIGGIVFAYIGAWLNHRVDPTLLRRVFAVAILLLSLKMLVDSFKPEELAPRTGTPSAAEFK